MNIVPMFLMIFIPWGIFVFAMGTQAFYLMYRSPFTCCMIAVGCILLWLATVLLAINRRKHDPEPAWYTFFAIVVGVAVFSGLFLGFSIYNQYSFPYYQVKDLKVIRNLDASRERGQNVMDAGLFYFAEGNQIDTRKAWHFKQRTMYCVAPIVMGGNQPATYDFWAVGKDCCSVQSSDFRCGAYNNPIARSGIRNMVDADRSFYRLAIEQAAALYGIQSENPIFFEWVTDPVDVVNTWNHTGFRKFMVYSAFAFVLFLFATAVAAFTFSFIGRLDDGQPMKEPFMHDKQMMDLHTHQRSV